MGALVVVVQREAGEMLWQRAEVVIQRYAVFIKVYKDKATPGTGFDLWQTHIFLI